MNGRQLKHWIFVSFLCFCLLSGLQFVGVVHANFLPIPTPQPAYVIQENGNIEPSTAPIQRDGDVYRLTDNIVDYTIAIERENIILDGNGYSLQGNENSTGVFFKNINNVTVKNMQISGCYRAIYFLTDVYASITGNHKIIGNNITDNQRGIYIIYSANNTFRNNQLNNSGSIYITYSPLSDDLPSFLNDIDASNTVNGKPIIYWVNQHDKTVPENAGQVSLVNCANILVQNLNLTDNSNGLNLVYTNDSTIKHNSITDNRYSGIYVYKSSENTITQNTIANNEDYGINLYYASNNFIHENTVTENNQDGIYFMDSSNNKIKNNTVTQNGQGVNVYSSSNNNIVSENTIMENSGYGVAVSWSSSNTVSGNVIEKNGKGINIEKSSSNRIIANTVKENNGWAIRISGEQQTNNTILHNYFIDNNVTDGLQVSMPGLWTPDTWEPANPCAWDDGEKGNYWSDYQTRYANATEIGETGTGDTSYYINPNNVDNYPLMEAVVVPEFSSWTTILLVFASVSFVVLLYRRGFFEKR